jgi:hypothetical protein
MPAGAIAVAGEAGLEDIPEALALTKTRVSDGCYRFLSLSADSRTDEASCRGVPYA